MNSLILNRKFQHPADGWYHIEPAGEHPNRAAGVVQVIDADACSAIVNRFNSNAETQGEDFPGMLICHEHFSHDSDKETRGYGWLMELQNRADDPQKPGIYGKINWTGTGKAAVDGGDYRYFSTEYDPTDLTVLNRVASDSKEPARVRPLNLAGLTLTNRPNNKGGKPITNRKTDLPGHPTNSPTGAQVDNQLKNKTTMKLIAQKLGLSADASEDAILGELGKLENRVAKVTEITTERDTLKNRVTTLETENGTLLDEQIGADLATHKVTDEKIINRLTPVLKTMKNREDRISFITDCVGKAAAAIAPQTKLFNRAGNGATAKGKGEGDNTAERTQATAIMNRASELQKTHKNLSHASAVLMAQSELEG